MAHAVWNDERLRIRYESWQGESEREIEPLGLVLKAGVWYAAARAGGKTRTYRLSNILDLVPTGERFVRPSDFDLAAYWRAATERFEAGLYRGEAQLRVSQGGLNALQAVSPAVAQAVRRTQAADARRGWFRVTIPIESVPHAATQLLALGDQAEVLAPATLRRLMVKRLKAATQLYAA